MPDVTASSSPWKVINYQIPVPIGDCSAHFLVKSNKVHRAFLMDGGTNAGTYVAWVQILKALRFIDLQLGNEWKFDSWVVTHWDADHYRGVKDLLLNEAIKFTRLRRAGKTVTRGRSGSFASLYFAEAAWLCCGAWDAEAMFKGGNEFLRLFVDEDNLESWRDLSMTVPPENEGQSLLRCIWGEHLIGLDLFTRSYQYNWKTGSEYRDTHPFDFELRLGSDGDAAAANNTPRFCVVGANGYGIGQSKPLKSEKPSKNETSILALLYWKGQKLCSYYTGGDGNPGVFKEIVKPWFDKTWPRCDVEMVKLDHHGSTRENLWGTHLPKDEVESSLKGGKKQQPGSKSMKKEQEEAGTDSANIRLTIEDMKPCKVLVTPGTLHGHPTWDVIIFLRDYFEKLSGATSNPSAMIQGLFTTRAVYWLVKGEVTLKDINQNHPLGKALERRGQSAAGDGSNKMIEVGEQASHDADEGVSDDEDDGNSTDSDFDIFVGRSQDLKDRQEGQQILKVAREEFNNHISNTEKKALQGRKGCKNKTKSLKYKFWLGQDASKKNYSALSKAVEEAKQDYREEERKEVRNELPALKKDARKLARMTPKQLQALRDALEQYATDEDDQSFTPQDEVEVRLRRELCDAFKEVAEAADDTKQEGLEDFRSICWQPLPASEEDDPHFIIRFEFGDRRQDTVVQVFDDSGRTQYMKKPLQDPNATSQHKEVKAASAMLKGSQQDRPLEMVKQSQAHLTGLLVEDNRNPWTRYAYGECAIATMLSDESIETIVKPALGACPVVSYGQRGPANIVFKYYFKREAAAQGIRELIELVRVHKQKRKNSTAQLRGGSRMPTDSGIAVETSKERRGSSKKSGRGKSMAEEEGQSDDESLIDTIAEQRGKSKSVRESDMAEEAEESEDATGDDFAAPRGRVRENGDGNTRGGEQRKSIRQLKKKVREMEMAAQTAKKDEDTGNLSKKIKKAPKRR
ncbi:hypothetical protein V8C44DRAFT_337868 [Trichoderma aethiopicum]